MELIFFRASRQSMLPKINAFKQYYRTVTGTIVFLAHDDILVVHCRKGVQTQEMTRGQSNLTKSASRGADSPDRGHPRGSKVVPLNSWGRVSY